MSETRGPGTLISARGRDWVVLPGSTDDLVLAQPLDGDREFIAALFPDEVRAPGFGDPVAEPGEAGDFASAGLLRTALRIASTAGAGPFRSLASIAVQPRQYQLVPLLMALRMDPVRLLIGDDVGIGKTVEAALIAKELIEQGSARGMTVLCSPALAGQWHQELRDKFGMEAELVLPSTAARLEKAVGDRDKSIFEHFPYTIVSTDFIKSDERREAFRNHCPDLLIVDEAHTCVGAGGGYQQRYELLRTLADRTERDRHLILITATPHSGDPDAFAKLTGLLDPALSNLDPSRSADRDRLARHFVQRRRHNIRHYLDQDTPFPEDRQLRPVPYPLDRDYARFVADVIAYARDQVAGAEGPDDERTLKSWWTVLGLLRCVLSSPDAAAATLAARSGFSQARTKAEVEQLARASVLERSEEEATEGGDRVTGSRLDDFDNPGSLAKATSHGDRRRLAEFAERAAGLSGPGHDAKLRAAVDEVKGLLVDGYDPIVFCHFIETAEYVARHLREELGRGTYVEAVTGKLHPDARQARIDELTAKKGRHVLVATDCLSEGVNLQDHFGAVVHYDLSWNPTRHEQREGRVDRFGQSRRYVRAVTLFDTDTGIDGHVLKVLIRKYRDIADQTGVAVVVPNQGEGVLRALTNSLLLRSGRSDGVEQLAFDFDADELLGLEGERLHREWESAAEQQSKVLTKFAQSGIRPEEVRRELAALRQALGDPEDIAEFTDQALTALGSQPITDGRNPGFKAAVEPLPTGLKHALGHYDDPDQGDGPGAATRAAPRGGAAKRQPRRELVFRTDLPVARGEHALFRTDPAVRAVARYLIDSAVDPSLPREERPARRLGVIRTSAVGRRTVLLLARYRFRLSLPNRDPREKPRVLVAEDAQLLAWRVTDDGGRAWLSEEETAALLRATPDVNTLPSQRDQQAALAVAELKDDEVKEHLAAHGSLLAERLRDAHLRVREAVGQRGRERGAAAVRRITVDTSGAPDLLGAYVYLNVPGGAR